MKGLAYILTYFYWQNGNRVIHSFIIYGSNLWSLEQIEKQAKDRIDSEEGIRGYYITQQEIFASNI